MFSKQEFEMMIETFSKEINYTDTAFEIFFMMKYGDKVWEEAYEVAGAFFSISRKAIYQESLLTIAKLYKSSSGSERNLPKFLNLIESNPLIYGLNVKDDLLREVKQFRELIKSKSNSIEKVVRWRDKILVHYDNEYFDEPSKIGEDTNLSAEEIRDLILDARNLINSFSSLTLNTTPCFRYNNYDDFKNLMSVLIKKK